MASNQATKRLISLGIAAVLLIAAFVVFSAFVRPAYRDSQSLKGQVISREEFLDRQQEVVSQVQRIVDSYQGEGELAQAVSFALPEARNESEVVRTLNRLAGSHSLRVETVNITASPAIPQGVSQGGAVIRPVGSVQARVRLIGSYEDVRAFLRNVETNIRVIDIIRADLSPVGEEQNILALDLTLVAYYQP